MTKANICFEIMLVEVMGIESGNDQQKLSMYLSLHNKIHGEYAYSHILVFPIKALT